MFVFPKVNKMSLSARKNTQNFSVKIQCFSWNLSFEHLFVE